MRMPLWMGRPDIKVDGSRSAPRQSFKFTHVVRTEYFHLVGLRMFEFPQALLVPNSRFAVLFHHHLIELEPRSATRMFVIHFLMVEICITGIEHPLLAIVDRHPGMPEGVADQWDHCNVVF